MAELPEKLATFGRAKREIAGRRLNHSAKAACQSDAITDDNPAILPLPAGFEPTRVATTAVKLSTTKVLILWNKMTHRYQ